MPASQVFRLTRNLILHVHRTQDAFDPAKHPRGHQGNAGQWQPDSKFHYADLVMPAHGALYEWDVERVNSDESDQ
jgi:hypothetical protein